LWSFWIIVHTPTIESGREPVDFNLPTEQVTISSKDGTALDALLLASPSETEKVLILLHGYPAEKGDLLPLASTLYPAFSILLLDLRSFGKSEGAYTTLGIRERDDVRVTIDFLETRGYRRIGIFGFSLGGAIALLTAAEDIRVDAVGAYASFASLRTLGHETYRNLWILKYPLVELLNFWSRVWFGTALAKLSPVDAASHISVPVFLIHTKKDEQIPFSHALALTDALEENPDLETYFPDKGLHGELPVDFNTRLKEFFNHSL